MGDDTQCERRAGDRRRQRQHTFRDRRTGFDRRELDTSDAGMLHCTLVGLRNQPKALFWLLVVVNVLNIADFGLTLNALAHGFQEGNPVMGFLFEVNPAWAGVFKVLAVVLASLLVWQLKRYRKALIAAIGMLLVFAGVFIWHLYGLAMMF
ncbi:MAG: hypothetical protein JW990_01895 [Thermoleophilia bacterium]|nr:hypothetical protein [Thermoleophilia bacterium]